MKKYSTTNLYESSYLLASGFRLVSQTKQGLKTVLSFQDAPELRQAILDFYNGTGMVSAKVFVDFYRSMKDLCCSKRG